ncbi:unnamed protein product [Cuscuta europaea]|uniref:Uncharacterized protein n=1 Tax=Cuscuta europaea TaxID=41803 RepID=A0A9P0ZKC4_CUSEU|nr:unnamed protein product [Cuscuta europaea]
MGTWNNTTKEGSTKKMPGDQKRRRIWESQEHEDPFGYNMTLDKPKMGRWRVQIFRPTGVLETDRRFRNVMAVVLWKKEQEFYFIVFLLFNFFDHIGCFPFWYVYCCKTLSLDLGDERHALTVFGLIASFVNLPYI